METVPETFEIETLLAESEWVGGLAASLVGNLHEAEDLAQDVWLAALRRPPGRRDSARPWMATVARNAARMLRRGDSARRARETTRAVEANETSASSPEELLARLESQELVLGLVRQLPGELADVISLTFFEGLSSEQIAHRRGLLAGTVRWRKKRALELLREQLDTHHGGERSVWLSALAPLATTGARTATLTPWITMALSWKTLTLAAALTLVLAGIAWQPWAPAGLDPGAVELALSDPMPVLPKGDPARLVGEEGELGARQPVVVVEEVLLADGAAGPAATMTRVRLRVIDANRNPVAGAVVRAVPSVELGRLHEAELSVFEKAKLLLLEASLEQTTDARGVATWATDFLRESGVVEFDAEGPYFGRASLSAQVEVGRDVDLGDVVLIAGGALSGRLRSASGSALGRRFVDLGPVELPKSAAGLARLAEVGLKNAERSVVTDTSGAFEFRGVPAGTYRVYASVWGVGTSGWSAPVEVIAGVLTPDVEVVLAGEGVAKAEVVVLDLDGQPVPEAMVELACGELTFSGPTNQAGAYTVPKAPALFEGGRMVVTDDSLLHRRVIVDPLTFEGGRLVVHMPAAKTAEPVLELVDPQGGAIDSASLRVATPEGTLRLAGFVGPAPLRVPSAAPFDLFVRVEGYAALELVGLSAATLPTPWRLTLEPLPGIRGRVLANGEPVSGARVRDGWLAAPGHVLKKGNWISRMGGQTNGVRTDAGGRFVLPHDTDGAFVLCVSAAGRADFAREFVDFDARQGLDDVVVELGRGGDVRGVVRDHTGASVPRASVVLNHPLHGLLEKTAGKDGSFHFRRVAPGDWNLRVAQNLESGYMTYTIETPENWAYPANCAVRDGADTELDLVLEDPGSSRISGWLKTVGSAVGTLSLEVEDGAGSMFARDPFAMSFDETYALGPGGTFDLQLPAGHDYDLAISSPELGGSLRRAVSRTELPLVLEAELGFASLDVQVADWLHAGSGAGWLGLTWSEDGWSFFQRLVPDADGRLDQVILPAGSVTVAWRPAPGAAVEVRTLVLEPGEERVSEL